MVKKHTKGVATKTNVTEVDAFLAKVAQTPLVPEGDGFGRIIFALDATASREPTWDVACDIQAEMVSERTAVGR